MKKKFYKYQSLGNDFIIFDWYKKDENLVNETLKIYHRLKSLVQNSCKRHFGVGADGVLILKKDLKNNLPHILLFNSDGTKAEICLNGLRCIASHLYDHYNFPEQFQIKIEKTVVNCFVEKKAKANKITTKVELGNYVGKKIITYDDSDILGHIVNVENPHFIIFNSKNYDWLKKNGFLVSNNREFEKGINVEIFWKTPGKPNNYNMFVYERGCGITLACSSGAAAGITLLYNLNKIKENEKITIQMDGGNVVGWIDKNQKINLQAYANFVFQGNFYLF